MDQCQDSVCIQLDKETTFAEINEKNEVVNVIVADQSFIDMYSAQTGKRFVQYFQDSKNKFEIARIGEYCFADKFMDHSTALAMGFIVDDGIRMA